MFDRYLAIYFMFNAFSFCIVSILNGVLSSVRGKMRSYTLNRAANILYDYNYYEKKLYNHSLSSTDFDLTPVTYSQETCVPLRSPLLNYWNVCLFFTCWNIKLHPNNHKIFQRAPWFYHRLNNCISENYKISYLDRILFKNHNILR